MRGILIDTLVELLDRRVVWVYAVVTVIAIFVIVATSSANLQIQGEEIDLSNMNDQLGNPLMMGVNAFAYVLVFLSVMASAGSIPGMLVKGRAEYYLSQPLPRTSLIMRKLLSLWLVYSGLVVSCVAVIWVVAGIVLGLFGHGLLWLLLIHILSLAIWLCVTACAGVVAGSAAMSMMAAFVVWVFQRILVFHEEIAAFADSKPIEYTVTGLYHLFPKTGQMYDLVETLVSGRPADWMPLYSSLLLATVLLSVTCRIFEHKSY
ncbi:MAG: ABC transporter permease subunit [Chitinivibrionia bacterium]|nr:ABC transporter permease subunit [Chitinivibrionia bacterium]